MSESQSQPFYEDFRAEADELLGHIRRLLGGVRGARGVAQRDLIAALLRQFHTLKGLTGMVGLKSAGHLTHLVESYLLRQQGAPLDSAKVVHLAAATRDLEALIANPDAPSDAVARYTAIFSESADSGNSQPAEEMTSWSDALSQDLRDMLSPSDRQLISEGLSGGSGLTLVTFASSAEKAERGIRVNDIRESLAQRAELVRVVPRISGRDVRFLFLLLSTADFDCSDLEVEREDAIPAGRVAAPEAGWNEEGTTMIASSLRVGTERLDEVVRLVEGLVVSRYRLDQRIMETQLPREVRASFQETALQMQRQLRDLTEALMRVRMVPLSDILQRLPLLTQELAHESGKQVELVVRGAETRVDKKVVERLLDPLLHLVRNAVAHGLEGPSERARLGKPETGRVTIAARPDGNTILIEVSDDGRGLDVARIAALARARGMACREDDPQSMLDVICQSGVSSREEAGFDAGRGVGMEIVRSSVEAVGGNLRMDSEPGFGTSFHLRVPMSTSIVDALLVEAAGATFAIPTQELQEVVDLEELARTRLRCSELVQHRGQALRLYQLPRLLSLEAGPEEPRLALIYGNGSSSAAFAVDRVTGLREVVVRTFGDPLVVRPWFLGATELGDGRLVLILHLPELLRRAA